MKQKGIIQRFVLPLILVVGNRQMVLNIDLAPTLLEMAGLKVPEAMQGESFLDILKDENSAGRSSWVYELFRDFPFVGRVPPHKALRTERYKYIHWA